MVSVIATTTHAVHLREGQSMTYMKEGKTEGDKINRVKQPSRELPFKAIIISNPSDAGSNDTSNKTIKFEVASLSPFTPTIGTKVFIQGDATQYSITDVDPVKSRDDIIYYMVEATG